MRFRSLVSRAVLVLAAVPAAAMMSAAAAEGPRAAGGDGPAIAGIFRGAQIASRFDVSPPLRTMRPFPVKPEPERDEFEDRRTGLEGPLGPQSPDSAVQARVGAGEMPSPITSFDGPPNLASVTPPDPVGDVGPDHYVVMSNLYFAIYTKAGALVYGPAANNTLWAGFGGPCQTENAGDPIVLYDQLADRWILTQFTSNGPNYFNCVAVSQSGDPTGSYYRYAFSTGLNFPDYPKYGIWHDALYISTREFSGGGGTFAGVGAYAINRAQLLAGNPAAQVISFLAPPGAAPYNVGDGLLPADLDGLALPPAGSPEYFVGTMDQGGPYGAPQDALSLWKFHADFAVPANSTFVFAGAIPVDAFDSIFPCGGGRACIPQPTTAVKLDILSYRQRPLHRLAYRNYGTHESLVTNQSVEAVAGMAGIRWYEIRDPNGTPTIHQQGTYAPGASDLIHRWMGSIAMDASGDIALGYSVSNATSVFPGVRYTGRLAGDPLGTMPQGEATIVNGLGSQTSGSSRWGDYTSMNVDPLDDCTFWYVNQYLPATSTAGWRLRIGSFKFPSCIVGPHGTLQGQVTVCGSGVPIASATVTAGPYSTVTDAGGNYSFAVPPGDHTVAITAAGYSAGGGPVTLTDGETTVLNACLTGIPVIQTAGATLQSEGCAPGNGRIDPGETVTVRFCLRNVGVANASNLVGELGETGGIGDAPDPVSFGAVMAGGPDVCQDVTFTASDALICGDDVAASFALEAGPAALGTADFTLPSGTHVVSAGENFDGVVVPALPNGWTSFTIAGPLPPWVTTAASSDTAPNAVFTPDPSGAGTGYVNQLISPPIAVTTDSATLSFRHNFDLESTFDGGVLEVSIDGGGFQDILAAGGAFLSGGYVAALSAGFSNPLGGRMAWTGNSNGYITTAVALPPSAAGQTVVFRWRCGVDVTVGAGGWFVDTVTVLDGFTCCTPIAEGLDVDPIEAFSAPSVSANGVWEPGETVSVEPVYFNGDSNPLALTGAASNLAGPPGATYTITDGAADYGSIASNTAASCVATGNCYSVTVDAPAPRPAPHWDATMHEALSNGSSKDWTLHIGASFADVPDALSFYPFIETIFHRGVTGGCGGTNYCPGNPALRKQMAVFLLKARYGSSYLPPPAAGVFADVPAGDAFAPWIEDLYGRGITGGCGNAPLRFCPDNTVLRQQMAVFLLKTLEGSDYEPPGCESVFSDVPCPSTFAAWIEELADRHITSGCGANVFCPTSPNTRGQMAVFLTRTFGLTLYGP